MVFFLSSQVFADEDTERDLKAEFLLFLETERMHDFKLQELIGEGLNPDEVKNQYGENALIVFMNRVHIVEGKESFKDSMMSRDDLSFEQKMKHLESHMKHFREIVETLLGEIVDPNAVDRYGKSLLNKAASLGDSKTVELLLKAGAKPNIIYERSWNSFLSPLHEALVVRTGIGEMGIPDFMMESERLATMRLLLEKGADPNATVEGRGQPSPAHLAVRIGNILAISLLHEFEADINQTTQMKIFEETPLDEAIRRGYPNVEKHLRALGGKKAEEISGCSVYSLL